MGPFVLPTLTTFHRVTYIFPTNMSSWKASLVRTPSRPTPVETTTALSLRLVAVPKHKHAEIVSTEEQWQLITLIQGDHTIDVLAEHVQYSPIPHTGLLHSLISLGLVEEQSCR